MRLGLDQVWLLVSPGNPLKPREGMRPLAQRLASAEALAPHRRVIATAIEARLGTVYSIDTLQRLRQAFPRAQFVWIIGADNWLQLPRWRNWRRIMRIMPVAVFPRPGFARAAGQSQVAQSFRSARLGAARAAELAGAAAPAWVFLPMREDPSSSTAIRSQYLW